MLVFKSWEKYRKEKLYNYRDVYTGWFLFGILPLIIWRERIRQH